MGIVRTRVDVLDVPREECVDDGVEEHHEDDTHQTELVAFDWRSIQIVPLNSNTLHLVKRKILRTETERRRRKERLKQYKNLVKRLN